MSNIIQIPLTRGMFASIDAEDFEKVSKYKWYTKESDGSFYAVHKSKPNHFRMHRLIMGITDPYIIIDHKDRNGLNNCKNNLRIATPQQNNYNMKKRKNSLSKYKGVSRSTKSNRWRARIMSNRKEFNLGLFETEIEAALAYNEMALILGREFANLNIIF